MVSPTKKRKLNGSSEASPKPARNLDFFFRKQTQEPRAQASNNEGHKTTSPGAEPVLTDEQLARKLQAEWDQDLANGGVIDQKPETGQAAELSGLPVGPALQPDTQEVSKSKTTLSLQASGSAEDTITSNIPFDESPVTFQPAKYIAALQDVWGTEGGSATYALLTRCFVLVNSTQSRIKIVDTLVNLLRVIIEGDPSSLLPAVSTIYYFTNFIKPNFWRRPNFDPRPSVSIFISINML
jgi:DNA ligase-1